MFTRFVEWSEKDISRGRKVVMFSTVLVYLFVVLVIVIIGLIWPDKITSQLVNIFMIFSGLMASVYAFYTGTSADKSSKLAEKAAEIMTNKINSIK